MDRFNGNTALSANPDRPDHQRAVDQNLADLRKGSCCRNLSGPSRRGSLHGHGGGEGEGARCQSLSPPDRAPARFR